MQTLIFDIETNAIDNFVTLGGLKEIFCVSIFDPRAGRIETFSKENVPAGLKLLSNADVIVGHNIIGFDIPAIQHLHPEWKPMGLVRDTLVISKLFDANIRDIDSQKRGVPPNMAGSHSLKAWGLRLGVEKGEFGSAPTAFDCWSEELCRYCEQDVFVTSHLYNYQEKNHDLSIEAVIIEHEFASVIRQQEMVGFCFDIDAAHDLHCVLMAHKIKIEEGLKDLFPPRVEILKTPQYYEDPNTGIRYPKKGEAPVIIQKVLVKGPLRERLHPFNPRSRDQIAKGLINKYGWKPVLKTPEGKPRVDEAVLASLDYPEAKHLSEYLMLSKRLGQLSDGAEAWLKVEKDGCIHGRVNTNGAITGRCTHNSPNISQVPNSHAPYGKECRALFTASRGMKLVGIDASGLELRCLAHYMGRYDNGEYTKVILEGDIHTANQKAAGLASRNQAKTFIYAFCYGAGDEKIGKIVGGTREEGKALKRRFLSRTPALSRLRADIKKSMEARTSLIGIDGRPLYIRSAHSALNALLQSAGAVIMKKATTIADKMFRFRGMEVEQVAHIHDEIQYQCSEHISEEVGKIVCQSIKESGEFFNFRCELAGEYRVGHTWDDTH